MVLLLKQSVLCFVHLLKGLILSALKLIASFLFQREIKMDMRLQTLLDLGKQYCSAKHIRTSPNRIIQINYSLSQVLTQYTKKYFIVLLDCFCPTSWHAKVACRSKKDILKLNKPICYMSLFTKPGCKYPGLKVPKTLPSKGRYLTEKLDNSSTKLKNTHKRMIWFQSFQHLSVFSIQRIKAFSYQGSLH